MFSAFPKSGEDRENPPPHRARGCAPVQSAFPEDQQGEISGLSRCVSNLGSSLGTAVAGTILVSGLATPQHSYALAMIALIGFGAIGAGIAFGIPRPGSVRSL